ncbi:hypothetical protein [Domibacillus aminovorans]|uniref:DUF4878 domain-containing protein n=1 Tax=Domibacillus aminovorans TaxID=29332 RepID=A0A177L1I4_9BACI|nr:hypothetical protein [Domibacillus aminovorans]OAH59187.1 hypothetical protein AWH49_18625 [Domibacillus aminovorans]
MKSKSFFALSIIAFIGLCVAASSFISNAQSTASTKLSSENYHTNNNPIQAEEDSSSIEPSVQYFDENNKPIYPYTQEELNEATKQAEARRQVFEKVKGTLINYLQAVKEKNVEGVLDLVIDERYEDVELQKKEYSLLLNKEELIAYEIDPTSTTDSSGRHSFKTILTYADGTIEQVPVDLVLSDGEWKVHIDAHSLDDDYKVIKAGDTDGSDS